MGLFKSGKTMQQRAQEERDKLEIQRTRIAKENADRELIMARRKKIQEVRRLTA